MMTVVVIAIVVVVVVFLAWRTVTLERELSEQQLQHWRAYAERLRLEAERDEQAQRVEADIDRLNNDDVVKRMHDAGYLVEYPGSERD